MKIMKYFLLLVVTLSLALATIPFSPVSAAGTTVSIGSPITVPEGGTFVVNVNIDTVTNLNSAQYAISYNPAVIQVISTGGGIGITDGVVGGTNFPVSMWNFSPSGTQGAVIALQSVSPVIPINGGGYLAQVHFQVLPGTAGQSSFINFVDLTSPSVHKVLFNNSGYSITGVTWTNGSVNVASSFSLTYTAGANGSVTGTSPQTVTSGGSGTAVTAVPAAGYHFLNWSDSSTANPRTDTAVTANITVTANFAINTYILTYTEGANGGITGTSPQTVTSGGSGTAVTAVPADGFNFLNWSDSSTANPRTDTAVTANITVTANFYLIGDANEDGVVNMGDATMVMRIILGLDSPTPGADANGDTIINMGDMTKIEMIILGLDPE